MKILIINPNSSTEMTKTIDAVARKYASPSTRITTVSVPDGPPFIANAYDAAIQTPKVLSLLERSKNEHDYFILACGLDPGLDACRLVVPNVIGIGEAAIMTACAVAGRFSILSSTPTTAELMELRVQHLGIGRNKFLGAQAVGTSDEIVRKRFEALDRYYEAGLRCVEEGARAIVLSCAGMSDIKEDLEQRLKVPVIAGVISGVKMAEQFCKVT